MKPAKSGGSSKKKSTKKPVKRAEDPPKPQVKVVNTKEREYLTNIRLFAELVKELLQLNSVSVISARGNKSSTLVVSATRYITALNSANCKLEMHHLLYREMYNTYRNRILKCIDNEAWMNKLTISVNIQLGKGTAYENKNVTLKISIACSNALKAREEIDNAKYDNINDREAATGKYEYQYVALFYFRLLTVIRDSLGEEHEDVPTLAKIIEHYRVPAGLASSEEESEGEAGEGISKFINDISGKKEGMSSKGVVKAIEKVTSDTSLIETIKDAVKDFSEDGKKGKKKKDQGEMFADMARKVGPSFANLFSSVGDMGGEDESGSEESGDDDTEESSE